MNPLTLLFRLPLLPLQGVLRLGELIQMEAERQLADPATVRRELEQIQQRLESGQMSEREAARAEQEAVTRFTEGLETGPAVPGGDED
jgi:Gas vesicle protein G